LGGSSAYYDQPTVHVFSDVNDDMRIVGQETLGVCIAIRMIFQLSYYIQFWVSPADIN
jgi:hypothetical protein